MPPEAVCRVRFQSAIDGRCAFMNTPNRPPAFWLGNGILAVAMLMLFYMGPLSEALGIWAAVLWMVVAGVGMALLLSDKSEPPAPD